MRTQFTFLATALLLGGAIALLAYTFAQAGSLDLSFDTDGKLTTNVGPGIDVGSCLAVQSDGKILLAGVSSNGSNDDFAVVRYHNDLTSGIEDFGSMYAESTVYPNPFTQGTTLKTNSELENATLEMFNVHGQKVQMLENLNGNSVSISRADLSGGIHFVTLSQDNIQIAQHKVIIVD